MVVPHRWVWGGESRNTKIHATGSQILPMEELLTAKEVQKILKVSLALVYKMARRGQLPPVSWVCPGEGKKRQKSMVRFKKQDLIEFVEKHYRNGHL